MTKFRSNLSLFCTAAVVMFISAAQANAGQILDAPDGGGGYDVKLFERIGSSFTAEDSSVFAALYFIPFNPSFDPTDPVTFELFSGDGVGGALLFSEDIVVTAGFTGFWNVDLSSVPLTVGSDYSFTASIDGTSPYWGIVTTGTGTHGTAIIQNHLLNVPYLALEVTPAASAVPEPSSFALAGLGGLALAIASIRRRLTAV